MREISSSEPEARLCLLGAPRGHVAGQDVQITHRKPLALLAYLAVTQRPHTREALATLFWPDSDTTRAYAYLRNALWQLGQTPFGPWLSVDQDTVELSTKVQTDRVQVTALLAESQAHAHPQPRDLCAECVRRLGQAVALYQGDFMEGFTLDDCPEFDTWQFFEADATKQAVSRALQCLVEHCTYGNDTRNALDYARRWVELDSLHEPAQRALIQLYAQGGQRAAALRQYESLVKDLKSSGLQPTSDTIELYKRVRSGEIRDATTPAMGGFARAAIPQVAAAVQAPPKPRHNLPAATTTFIGRATELQGARELLAREDCRLITLVGPGGIGKTRLALKLGHEALDAFADGVFFVPLVAVQAPDLVVAAIADAMGASFYPQGAMTPQEQLLGYLGDRQVLLLLDNVEHLLQEDAAAAPHGADVSALFTEIIARTPRVKLLVTSRERLNLQGEWAMELGGLDYPQPEGTEAATPIGSYDAVRLFVETARRVASGFEPDASDLAAIARICTLVEGMPLGLELAAAWTKMLPCAEIADEVETSLDFLTLTLRDLPERHQSLRAVFARSWGLLSEEERRHFRALAIFRGGFTREAAHAVAGASLPLLSGLMDKSLLRRTADHRYEILEVLRQYAGEQLNALPGEAEEIQTRHALTYLSLVERMATPLKGDLQTEHPVGQRQALDEVERDLGNIRLAWQWAAARGMFEEIERAVMGLALYYDIRSRFRQGLAMFREAASALEMAHGAAGETGYARLLGLLLGIQGEYLCRIGEVQEGCAVMARGYALLAPLSGDRALALLHVLTSYVGIGLSHDERKRRLEESIEIYRSLGDAWGLALSKEVLGELISYPGNWETADRVLQESLQLRRQTGDEWGTAMSLYMLGINAVWQGKTVEARHYLEESLLLRQELGDIRGVTICQNFLGTWLASTGELEAAETFHLDSLRGFERIGDAAGSTDALIALGDIARAKGELSRAHETYLRALAQRRKRGAPLGIAGALQSLGDVAVMMGQYGAARAYYGESLSTLAGIVDAAAIASGTRINGLSLEAFTVKVQQSLAALDAVEAS